jgi:hypothetical protein
MSIAPLDGSAELVGEHPALAETQGLRQQLFLRDGGFAFKTILIV